jgi:hypothetical protein
MYQLLFQTFWMSEDNEEGPYGYVRRLTYLDDADDDGLPYDNETLSRSAEVGWLSALSVAFGLMAVWNIRVSSASQAFYEWNAIRLILPGVQWIMVMDCATLAADRGMATIDENGTSSGYVASRWAIAMYMLQSTVTPGLFISTFVITFLAYRNRSIPFFMVQRAPGRNDTHLTGNTVMRNSDDLEGAGDGGSGAGEAAVQPLIRPATMVAIMRLFSLFCFLLALVVNFDVVWSDPDLAGRTGWATLISQKWDPDGSSMHIFLSLLPMALVGFCCFYFAMLLWRYGTFFSMKIYASIFNPWASPVFGTIFLLGGQCFGSDLFPVMSRTGIWLYQLCFLRVMYEVRYDIKQAGDLGLFLDALGDDTITGSVATPVDSEKSVSRQRSRDFQNLPS